MDVFDEFLLDFWKSLQNQEVKYIMIGGFAVRFHGYNRTTDHLDLWIEDTLENRKNLRDAIIKVTDDDFPSLEDFTFVPGWSSFYVGPGIELDIMTSLKGLENISFQECLEMASIAEIMDVRVPFLQINQLITNKKATNRPKDAIDLLELTKIKNIREAED